MKELRVDEIKIDRCFVTGIQFASYNYHLVSNVLELAKDANIRVCCEGVEKKEEMKKIELLKLQITLKLVEEKLGLML